MSFVIIGHEDDPIEAFDWHHEELFKNPPYGHTDMVYMLDRGDFLIEGKKSNWSDALLYVEKFHHNNPEAWEALKACGAGLNQLALEGPQLVY